MTYNELYHYGIKGQKWGVRRYQNADGSLTSLGRTRYGNGSVGSGKRKRAGSGVDSDAQKKVNSMSSATKKKILMGVAMAATAASAAVYVKRHPEVIANVVNKVKNVNVSELAKKKVDKGKQYVKDGINNFKKGVKDGIREGLHDAPKNAVKVVINGVVLYATKKALDKYLGEEESTIIFQANDKKKIKNFWKVSPEQDRQSSDSDEND